MPLISDGRSRGDLATGEWNKHSPLPVCKGCGQVIETMWAIPAHIDHRPFEVIYPERDGRMNFKIYGNDTSGE